MQWKSNKYYIFWVCVCVFVALDMQHAMRVRHVVICGLSGCNIISPQKLHNFRGGKIIGPEMYVLIFSTIFFFCNISHSKKN